MVKYKMSLCKSVILAEKQHAFGTFRISHNSEYQQI